MLPTGVSNWLRNSAPPAIAGSGGHNSTYSVACSLWRMLGDESAVWEGLNLYNAEMCSPAWSEKELRHKLAQAEKATRGERATQPQHYGTKRKSRAFQPPKELPNITLNFARPAPPPLLGVELRLPVGSPMGVIGDHWQRLPTGEIRAWYTPEELSLARAIVGEDAPTADEIRAAHADKLKPCPAFD